MADVTRDPRAYELMTIFLPELSDEELVEQVERVSGYITAQQGVITETLRESPWGRRRLAYTIRFNSVDYRDGIYVVFHFDSVPSVVTEIERELKLDTRVMRYLLVHDDPLAGEQGGGQFLDGDDAEATPEDGAAEPEATEETPAAEAPAVETAAAEEAEVEIPVEAPAEVAEEAAAEEVAAEEPTTEEEVAPAPSSDEETTKED